MTFSKIGLVLTLFILLKIAVRHGIRGLEVSKKVDKPSIHFRLGTEMGNLIHLGLQQFIYLDVLNFLNFEYLLLCSIDRDSGKIFKIENSRCPNL